MAVLLAGATGFESNASARRQRAPGCKGAVYELEKNVSAIQVQRAREEVWRSWEVRGGLAEDIGKVLFSHESRILTPGSGSVSPGGAGPPPSPPTGHYRPPAHSPPLVKVSATLISKGYSDQLLRFTLVQAPAEDCALYDADC